jgi:hypothetical protein
VYNLGFLKHPKQYKMTQHLHAFTILKKAELPKLNYYGLAPPLPYRLEGNALGVKRGRALDGQRGQDVKEKHEPGTGLTLAWADRRDPLHRAPL